MKSSRRSFFAAFNWYAPALALPMLAGGCDVGSTSAHLAGATGAGGAGASQGTSTVSVGASVSSGSGGAASGSTSSAASTGASSGGGGQPLPGTGYHVQGNTILDDANKPHLFHGVARPSMEWSATGEHIALSDFQAMKGWGANVVRIALNQDFWLPAASKHDGAYKGNVDQAIHWAHQAGLDVILDLHWSDRGDLGNQKPDQQRMADTNSVTFWTDVAGRYKNDLRVLFELYNEPHDVSWDVWLNGGQSGDGFAAAGMQQLYDAVRKTGANNLVVVGGLNWAYDLSGVPAHRVKGQGILYATHPYAKGPEKYPAQWTKFWGSLAATDPVIVTEFGTQDCTTDYYTQLLQYADQHGVSWTAWAWFPGGCGFPSLINDWSGATNAPGQVVKTHLLSYP